MFWRCKEADTLLSALEPPPDGQKQESEREPIDKRFTFGGLGGAVRGDAFGYPYVRHLLRQKRGGGEGGGVLVATASWKETKMVSSSSSQRYYRRFDDSTARVRACAVALSLYSIERRMAPVVTALGSMKGDDVGGHASEHSSTSTALARFRYVASA